MADWKQRWPSGSQVYSQGSSILRGSSSLQRLLNTVLNPTNWSHQHSHLQLRYFLKCVGKSHETPSTYYTCTPRHCIACSKLQIPNPGNLQTTLIAFGVSSTHHKSEIKSAHLDTTSHRLRKRTINPNSLRDQAPNYLESSAYTYDRSRLP